MVNDNVSLKGDYNFDFQDPVHGSGEILLTSLNLGIEPHSLHLLNQIKVPIKDGTLFIHDLIMREKQTDIAVNGTVSAEGLNINTSSKIKLDLLHNLVTAVDNLRGLFEGNFNIKGPYDHLVYSGDAKLRDAEVAIEEADINIHSFSGDFKFENNKFFTDGLVGYLNDGTIKLTGELDLDRTNDAQLNINFDDIVLEPIEKVAIKLSGDLSIKNEDERPKISGKVKVNRAEVIQSINLLTAIKSFTNSLLNPQKPTQQSASDNPDIGLDVHIEAPRNMMILTNLFQTELKCNIHVGGSTLAPQINGMVKTISGHLAFTEHSFEITSGTIIFTKANPEGRIEILGETTVFNNAGNVENVFLEASGSLNNPYVRLTSSSNLSQGAIINLLMSAPASTKTSFSHGVEFEEAFSLLPRKTKGFLGFLNSLTKIDSISIEPSQNTRTNSLQPIVVARKDLNERMSLIGETGLGSSEGSSKLKFSYALNPKISLLGVIDNNTTSKKNAVEGNAIFTIIPSKTRLTDITFKGNKNYDFYKLISELQINENSTIKNDELDNLIELLRTFYHKQGYFDVEIFSKEQEKDGYISKIEFKIKEGNQHNISDIKLVSEKKLKRYNFTNLIHKTIGQPATEQVKDELVKKMKDALKKGGYIGSTIRASYDKENDILNLKVYYGNIIKIDFVGNTHFKEDELLDTIQLYNRKQPFGNNTIHSLIKGIKDLYIKHGFYDVKVRWKRSTAPKSTTYLVNINEGTEFEIDKVELKGYQPLSKKKLNKELEEQGSSLDLLLEKRHLLKEELAYNTDVLSDIYKKNGFPTAEVTSQLAKNTENNTISIIYNLGLGEPQRVNELIVTGWPIDLKMSDAPKVPASIPIVERYTKQLIEDLHTRGYFTATGKLDIIKNDFQSSVNNSKATITLQPNERTFIDNIRIIGNKEISTEFILNTITVKQGSPWSIDNFLRSRRKLLKTGLFTNIEFTPEDTFHDGKYQNLLITVRERKLNSLELGLGLNSEYGFHIFGEATNRSIFKDGRSLSLRSDIYYDPKEKEQISQGVANLRYSHPEVFGSKFQLTEDLRIQKLNNSSLSFYIDRFMFNTNLSRSRGDRFSYSFGHSLYSEDLSDVAEDIILSSLDYGTHTYSVFSASMNYDRRDNPITPRNGYYFSLSSDLSDKSLGSAADYFSLQSRLSAIHQLGKSKFGIGDNFVVGNFWKFGSTDEIPLSQRYFLGGRNSIRGFKENSLGPKGEVGHVMGGDFEIVNNLELSYDFTEVFQMLTFLDAGNAFPKSSDFSIDDLRWSTGIGVRYVSPIGPLGFDVAHPLDREGNESSLRFHFSIGSTF